jgi:hypothetical protein
VVKVNSAFAASCNFKSDFLHPIKEGEHYGTLLLVDVEDGPPLSLVDVSQPWELVLLWVVDTWIGNIDREINGNTLLQHAGSGRFHVIAADQSDCFGGASNFSSDGFPTDFLKQGSAPAPAILAAAIGASGGRKAVSEAIKTVQGVVGQVSGVLSTVPDSWWGQGAIQPSSVLNALHTRAERLPSIINPSAWELPDGVLL